MSISPWLSGWNIEQPSSDLSLAPGLVSSVIMVGFFSFSLRMIEEHHGKQTKHGLQNRPSGYKSQLSS